MASPGGHAALRLLVDGQEVADVLLADSLARRLRGMLARDPLPEAMLFVPGGAVHGVGMTVALDVALLSPVAAGRRSVVGEHRVHKTARLRPLGLVGSARGVRSTLEAPAGRFEQWGLTTASVVEIRRAPR